MEIFLTIVAYIIIGLIFIGAFCLMLWSLLMLTCGLFGDIIEHELKMNKLRKKWKGGKQ